MSVMDCAAEDDLQFPAFLTRDHEPAAPAGRVPCNSAELRPATYWGAAGRLLRFVFWPFSQLRDALLSRARIETFMENDMSRNGAGIAHHQTPAAPVLEESIAKPLFASLETFRAVEGEKSLNMLLHELLLKSNQKLVSYGVQPAFRETAELESLRAQLKRQQDANARGSAEHKALQHAANEALQALAIIAGNGDEHGEGIAAEMASKAIKNWEAATNPAAH